MGKCWEPENRVGSAFSTREVALVGIKGIVGAQSWKERR